MEYHDKPLQFRSYHYFKVKDYNNFMIASIMIAIAYLPILLILFVTYVTITYITPIIFFYHNQYLLKKSSEGVWLFSILINNLFVASLFILLLIISHIYSFDEFNKYCNEVLDENYYTVVLIGMVISSLGIVIMFPAVIILTVKRWKYMYMSKVVFPILVTLAIVYIMSYFFLFVILAFMQDPLLMTLYYCIQMSDIFFISFCFYVCESKILYPMYRRSLFISVIINIVLLGLIIIFVICTKFLISGVFAFGAFSDSQAFQALILSLLIGLLSFFVFKPIYRMSLEHFKLSKDTYAEGKSETMNMIISSKKVIIINQPTDECMSEVKVEEVECQVDHKVTSTQLQLYNMTY